MPRVIIAVHGGCVSLVSAPKETTLEIRDYDTDCYDEDVELDTDSDGDEYRRFELLT